LAESLLPVAVLVSVVAVAWPPTPVVVTVACPPEAAASVTPVPGPVVVTAVCEAEELVDVGPSELLTELGPPPKLVEACVALVPPPPDDSLQAIHSQGIVSKKHRQLIEPRYHGSSGAANPRAASAERQPARRENCVENARLENFRAGSALDN